MRSPTSSSDKASAAPYAVRQRLTTLGRTARKSLGQNFLNNKQVAERIVALACAGEVEEVLEIGPGLGALTELLVARAPRLTLVELDHDLAGELAKRFESHQHVRVIEADLLKLDLRPLQLSPRTVAVGNLPYNVANPIIAKLLSSAPPFERIVAMVQLEVARRFSAAPGSSEYGALSVFMQIAARIELAIKVSAGSFVPRPKVDSAVVVLEPHERPIVELRDPELFRHVVRTVFSQRRKQLLNSIRAIRGATTQLLEGVGIDPKRRPETLSLAEFASLANALAQLLAATDE